MVLTNPLYTTAERGMNSRYKHLINFAGDEVTEREVEHRAIKPLAGGALSWERRTGAGSRRIGALETFVIELAGREFCRCPATDDTAARVAHESLPRLMDR